LTYGRTVWASYAFSFPAKHYSTSFLGEKEPPRVTSWRHSPEPLPSDSHLRTWLPELDCLGQPVVGAFYANGTLIQATTFTGSGRQRYEVGLDLDSLQSLNEGRVWEARYSSSNPFKHYGTELESEAWPYKKNVWAFSYQKLGGASQVDVPRFWSLEYDAPSLATCTAWWDVDGAALSTQTLTLTAGNGFLDRLALPFKGRGRLFQCRLRFDVPCGVAAVNVDLLQEGIKGLTRRGKPGSPRQ